MAKRTGQHTGARIWQGSLESCCGVCCQHAGAMMSLPLPSAVTLDASQVASCSALLFISSRAAHLGSRGWAEAGCMGFPGDSSREEGDGGVVTLL